MCIRDSHISDTSTPSGIIFPDGSFQNTATKNTPSFGYQGTIQFAGAGNTFAGDSDHLFWDYTNTSLVLNNGANAIVSGSLLANAVYSNTFIQGNDLTVVQTTVQAVEAATGIVFAIPKGHNKAAKEPIWPIDFKSVAVNKKQLCKGAE